MRIKDICITPALNGYICQVGCQRIVFQSRSGLVTELALYLENPLETEKRYRANAVNPIETEDCRPEAAPAPSPDVNRVERRAR